MYDASEWFCIYFYNLVSSRVVSYISKLSHADWLSLFYECFQKLKIYGPMLWIKVPRFQATFWAKTKSSYKDIPCDNLVCSVSGLGVMHDIYITAALCPVPPKYFEIFRPEIFKTIYFYYKIHIKHGLLECHKLVYSLTQSCMAICWGQAGDMGAIKYYISTLTLGKSCHICQFWKCP